MSVVRCALVFDGEDHLPAEFASLPRRGDRVEAIDGDGFAGRWVVSRVEWMVERSCAGLGAHEPAIHLTRELGFDR